MPLKGPKNAVFVLVNLTSDFDHQTRPSKGPNTSFLWIWRISLQRFSGYFIHRYTHKNKSSAVAEMGDRLATIGMGWKLGPCPLFLGGELGPI